MKKISALFLVAVSLTLTACNKTSSGETATETTTSTVAATTTVPITTTTTQPTTTTVTTTIPTTTVTTTTPETTTVTTFDTSYYQYNERQQYFTCGYGRLYAAPDENSEVLYTYESNTILEIDGYVNDWFAVYIDNRIAFVKQNRLVLVETTESYTMPEAPTIMQ